MCRQDITLLVESEPGYHLEGVPERVVAFGKAIDQDGATLEELCELVGAQLPR